MISVDGKASHLTLEDKRKSRATVTAQALRDGHFEAIYAYVSRRVKPREDAEDVTQETFVAAFGDARGPKGDVRLWLYGIARRKVADLLRKRSRRPVAGPVAVAEIACEVEEREAAALLCRLVYALPADQRDALLLQHLEELSLEEIGVVMGRSAKSVKGLLARAKASLRAAGHGYFASEENNS